MHLTDTINRHTDEALIVETVFGRSMSNTKLNIMNTETVNTVNSLKYKTSKLINDGKEKLTVSIRLNDECKNGYSDFAITADLQEKRGNGRFYWSAGGCLHAEIAKHFPEFQLFIDLHLSDQQGRPVYSVANGFYHLQNSTKDVVMNYLRISETEYNELFKAEDEIYFSFLLEQIGIVDRWKAEADHAKKQLEQLTGLSFYCEDARSNYTPLKVEVKNKLLQKIENGYYTSKKIQARKDQAKQKAFEKKRNDLIMSKNKDIKKIEDDFIVKLYVFDFGLPIDNFIYYNHTNTGVFNWKNSPYNSSITGEQFNNFIKDLDYSKLPEGIKFELK